MGRLIRCLRRLFRRCHRVAPQQSPEQPVAPVLRFHIPSPGDILRPLEHFRDRPLTLALALEALLQLTTMRPKFSCDMISAILHRTMEAVLQGPEKEEEREELKRHFRLLLGSLLMEAPNPGTLLQLLSDLRGYALGESGEAQKLAASSISLLLAVARKFPRLRMTVVRPDLACFHLKPEGEPHTMETANYLVSYLPKTHF
ncbi:uncharacterized protein LOC132593187 [Zootoca vivipara]|uniref:uncharacterized protein LOC132593187 n=1 Tax=Zootoca vivipara TaxID=8524 RepID=UPI00293BDC15|nr:uncharacterized protein LOC132593187 [Zootoca vivipara]